MQRKQVQKNSKTAHPWSAPIMTYLVGSKSPPLKYSWAPLLLPLLVLVSSMGWIEQERRSNHTRCFTKRLESVTAWSGWLKMFWSVDFPLDTRPGYKGPVSFSPGGEISRGVRWAQSREQGGLFPEKDPLIGLKPRGRGPPSRARGELDSIIHTHTYTHTL